MMHELLESVKGLVREELTRVTAQHGSDYHSLHEAYAVMLEELEEAEHELQSLKFDTSAVWNGTKRDNYHTARTAANSALIHAMFAACESIQVAAVATKVLKTIDRIEKEMQD